MKLTVALLVFVVESVPQKRKKANTHPVKTLPSISCEDHGVQITNIDHGKSGQLSVDKYDNNMHCYIDFAKKCVKGVDVKFTHLSVETSTKFDYYQYNYQTNEYEYNYDGCFDTVHFAYKSKKGELVQTEGQCGCLGEETDSTCDQKTFNANGIVETEKPTKYVLDGNNVKLIMTTDSMYSDGKVTVDWKCRGMNSSITNTFEMAEYLLTGSFKVSMATDYGCNGRGTFDPFSPSLGSRLDSTDGAFAKWKQCIQCASGNDVKNVLAYNYDPVHDTCENGPSRAFCECDKNLVKFLKKAHPIYEPYPANLNECVLREGLTLSCCNWDTYYWGAYISQYSCCDYTGIKDFGLCTGPK